MADTIRAPRGPELTCKGWPQEAALRMLMNNLDPEVAERPADLVVYGGTGKAARSWDDYHVIVRELRRLEADQTLLVQSGRAVGVFRTHEDAPRVLIANSNLVGKWATWEHFHELERRGLMMYGQMTAGSWIYIGSQGIVQGTFETFAAAGKQHWDSDLSGRFVLSGGLGGMGGAQPLAATMAGAVFLGVEIDPSRVQRRLETRYLDEVAPDLDAALRRVDDCRRQKVARSIAVVGNAADVYAELVRRGITPDLVTDQTSAHDPLHGYIPQGLTLEEAAALRAKDAEEYVRRSRASMAVQVEAMVAMLRAGAHVHRAGLAGGLLQARVLRGVAARGLPLLDAPADRQIAVHRVVRAGLVRHGVWTHAALHQFGQYFRGVAEQANGNRLLLGAGVVDHRQRFVERIGALVEVARLQTLLDAVALAFDGEA